MRQRFKEREGCPLVLETGLHREAERERERGLSVHETEVFQRDGCLSMLVTEV